ncbi:hypothetical protein jhhlp_001763 [Lomentospora prolificans]|uniref:NAD-dependent epimerase/dehydratase domain-containing protein n=1 Tax=Lomentospora prolificans TaxID=41688 RepID=A0A2N3NGP7_9PEZI|nr:hypothetical protein jhhlp_001763 [Lomentospora prolificans]
MKAAMDVVETPIPQDTKWPQNANAIKADLVEDSQGVVDKNLTQSSCFMALCHPAQKATSNSGMKVTFDAIRALLESLRKVCPRVRVMYTSSQTVYTGDLVQPVNESMRATPQSSYGCAKVMCEYLLNDILAEISSTAFILRLPTIPVRPGKPTAAVTSFLSGMILREPMQGLIPCVIPLKDRNFSH